MAVKPLTTVYTLFCTFYTVEETQHREDSLALVYSPLAIQDAEHNARPFAVKISCKVALKNLQNSKAVSTFAAKLISALLQLYVIVQ